MGADQRPMPCRSRSLDGTDRKRNQRPDLSTTRRPHGPSPPAGDPVTTRFRIDSVTLHTTEGDVRYDFTSELTVLAGDPGVGKTTLLELIKFGFGGNAVLADVALNYVDDVTLDVAIGPSRLRITRSLDSAKQGIARVTDLATRERLPDYRIGDKPLEYPSLNTLLMTALGLPDDMRAASSTKNSDKPGSRITFAD